jgi:inner membrane protease ATP23
MVVDVQIEEHGVGEQAALERCENFLQRAIHANPTVQFMLKALRDAGCPVLLKPTADPTETDADTRHSVTKPLPNTRIFCRHCEAAVGGGFQDDGTVILCANHIRSQAMASTTLVHELIHAFDQCRAYLDWSNCIHHACSEIRAATLSGDCDWIREVARSHFRIGGQFRRCIKRRAEMSVRMNRNCSELEAHEAVERAFETCYRDTAPFDRIP